MRASDVLLHLQELTADQWGLFTTAQAKRQGIIGTELSRASRAGHIEPIIHGVHRLVGTPSDQYESLRAAWLGTDPGRPAHERLGDENGVVVSGTTAAWLHGIGDLPPEPYEFSSPTRRQSRRPDLRFRRRFIPQDARTIAEGLPVTTVEQTIGDLVRDRTDESLVVDCLLDAFDRGQLRTDVLATALDPEDAGRGAARRDDLLRAAGLDGESMVHRVAESPLGSAIAVRAFEPFLAEVRKMMGTKALDDVLRKKFPSTLPASRSFVAPELVKGFGLPPVMTRDFRLPPEVLRGFHLPPDVVEAWRSSFSVAGPARGPRTPSQDREV
ncbi:type IV toxin-antitoxin system AbiEi family antitoxin domain-containing protein [Kocuria marina]|uniref:type IV toxin-antitoxin system AbiEi family antitoxin domain-containing protein n=2 Tax=Kocuria marina TaxID=223184 RepID=UPI0012EC661B|nr:type IV toxin-antitoxin system AbiEi family antitoxin domain-containing protein [Kocuria marina]